MAVTADHIRALSGLSAAELTDEAIAASFVLDRVELDAQTVFTTLVNIQEATTTEQKIEAFKQHDYKVWKAIVYLEQAIKTAIPQTLKDNFNQFTRFSSFTEMIDFAKAFTGSLERQNTEYTEYLFAVISPDIDPVTEG